MRSLVKDLMTTPVVTVGPATPFKEIVARLAEHRVSAVPVVDDAGRVLGVVSEADLLLKEEHPDPDADLPLIWTRRRRAEHDKAAAAVARDLMPWRWCPSPPMPPWPRRPGTCTAPESSGCPWSTSGAGWSGSSAAPTC
jgi:CBS domain